MKCKECGSFAINDHKHGRVKGECLDLCDVCYWRVRASKLRAALAEIIDKAVEVARKEN